MNFLLLISVIIGVSIQQVCQKSYTTKDSGGAYTFSAAIVMFAALFFIITANGDFSISKEAFWFAILFALSYGIGTLGGFFAIATGPLSLTGLIIQYSLIIPTMYGIIMLSEPVDISLVLGIAFLLISLFLINVDKKGEQKRITLKWIIYVSLSFLGNGICSTVQKVQQIVCNGMYKNQFMIIALLIVVVVLVAFALKKERKLFVPTLKNGFWQYAVCGLANGLVNLFVILLSTRMDASVMFPIISAGGIILTAIIALTLYKEKLSKQQYTGLLLGIASIIFLNF